MARPHVRLPGADTRGQLEQASSDLLRAMVQDFARGAGGGEHYMIVASKGDAPKHPGWYQNLAKEPQVELQVKGEIPVVVLERG